MHAPVDGCSLFATFYYRSFPSLITSSPRSLALSTTPMGRLSSHISHDPQPPATWSTSCFSFLFIYFVVPSCSFFSSNSAIIHAPTVLIPRQPIQPTQPMLKFIKDEARPCEYMHAWRSWHKEKICMCCHGAVTWTTRHASSGGWSWLRDLSSLSDRVIVTRQDRVIVTRQGGPWSTTMRTTTCNSSDMHVMWLVQFTAWVPFW